MVYVGSKSKIASEIVDILQFQIFNNKIKTYAEPFCGGCNIIDKIKCDNKIANDINKYLIALLQYHKDFKQFPLTITEEIYNDVKNNRNNYDDYYVGLIGFLGSFGTKFFGGYARDKQGKRNIYNERIRNFLKQDFSDITFFNKSYIDLEIPNNSLIYCDIPYKNTTKYSGTESFNYDLFYEWCIEKSKNNIVIISEYEMPNDFKCIKEIKKNCYLDSNRINKIEKIEKLFVHKDLNIKLNKLF